VEAWRLFDHYDPEARPGHPLAAWDPAGPDDDPRLAAIGSADELVWARARAAARPGPIPADARWARVWAGPGLVAGVEGRAAGRAAEAVAGSEAAGRAAERIVKTSRESNPKMQSVAFGTSRSTRAPTAGTPHWQGGEAADRGLDYHHQSPGIRQPAAG
jgi:hypothetical protein